jgi:hypothetical protein
MDNEQELVIRITASNLSKEGFDDARRAIAGLSGEAEKGRPKTKGFGDEIRAAANGSDIAQFSFSKLAASWVAGLLSVEALKGGVRLLVNFLSESVKQAAEADAINRKLDAALRAQGNSAPNAARAYRSLSTELQKTTVHSDDLISEMQTLLIQVGNVMPSQMRGALRAAMDLSAGLGIDLRTATMLVGKAFAGETGTLGKYGIQLDDLGGKISKAEALQAAIEKRFGGQAQAEVESYSGQVQQLSNAWSEVQEAIGQSILQDPMLQRFFRDAMGGASGLTDKSEELGGSFTRTMVSMASTTRHSAAINLFFYDLIALVEGADSALAIMHRRLQTQNPLEKLTAGLKAGFPPGYQEALTASIADGKRHAKVLEEQAAAAKKAEEAYQKWRAQVTGQELRNSVSELDARVKRLTASGDLNATSLKAIAEECAKLRAQGAILTPELNRIDGSMRTWGAGLPKVETGLGGILKQLRDLNLELPKYAGGIASIVKIQQGMPTQLPGTKVQLGTPGFDFKTFGSNVAGSIMGAIQGGGNVGQAAGASIGSQLFAPEGPFGGPLMKGADKLGSMIGGKLGSSIGGMVGSAIPVLGTIAGSMAGDLLGKAASWVMGIFGNKEKKANQDATATVKSLSDELVRAYGGVEKLREASRLVGMDLYSAFGHQGKKGLELFQKDIEEFQRRQNRLQSALEKYGFTWEDMGQKARQSHLDKWAQELIADHEALALAQIDNDVILKKMAGSYSQLAQAAIRTGTEIPAAMRPTLEQLLEMGELVDADGNKLTDLSGINFAEPITKGFTRVVDKLDEMMRRMGLLPDVMERSVGGVVDRAHRMAGGITDALRGLPNEIRIGVRFDVERPDLEFPKGIADPYRDVDIDSFATGGIAVGRQLAWVGDSPSRKEIIGDVDFMTRALAGAIERMGTVGTVGAGAAGQGDVYIAVDPASGHARQLTLAEFKQIERAINGRVIRVGRDAIVARAS